MIHFIDVAKWFGKRTLFEHANLHIAPGERIGLVGPNGSGKTTIFRLIDGEMDPDEGDIRMRKDLRIGYLRQETETRRQGEVFATVVDNVREIGRLRAERDELLVQVNASAAGGEAEALAGRLAEAEDRFERAGGYTIEAEAREVLRGLGFTAEDMARPLSSLSGGWHVRVELARLLLEQPDILLLDEPTNHLDLESIEWFENYLAGFSGAFVLVSHDREFLNRAVNRVIDVRSDGLRSSAGDYDTYTRRRAEDEGLLEKRYKEQQARIRELQDFIERNRSRKDRARQVQSRVKTLEGIERIALPKKRGGIHFRFPQPERSGDNVIRLEGLGHSYGEKQVLSGIDLLIRRGQRIAFVGVNGAGKSTILKILADRLVQTEGTKTLGSNVSVDFFAQHQLEALQPGNTVLQEMHTISDLTTSPAVRGILGAFQFSGDEVDKSVSVLSGGEKARLALAKMLLKPANCLVLDEPTNHLDIDSREVLEAALAQYDGTLCVTSHDRRFIDKVANLVIEVSGGRLAVYPGNYSDYHWKKTHGGAEREVPSAAAAESTTEAPSARQQDRDRKRREAEQRAELARVVGPLRKRLDDVEADIASDEDKIARLEKRLAEPELYARPEEARRYAAAHEKLKNRLEDLYEKWETVHVEVEEAESRVIAEAEE